MKPKDLVELLDLLSGDDKAYYYGNSDFAHWGWVQTPERVAAVAELAAKEYPGDLVEIGCRIGVTTVRLCKVALQYGRRVIAIDSWEPGTPGCEAGDYEQFVEATKEYSCLLDVLRLKSQDPYAILLLKRRTLAFAFVDGLHTGFACYSDILAVGHAPVIAVDDIVWSGDIMMAYTQASTDTEHRMVRFGFNNEGYLLK